MKYTDPDGNFVITSALILKVVSGAAIGALVGAASNIIVQTAANYIQNGGDLKSAISSIDMKSVGTAALSGAISGAITGGVSQVSTAYNTMRTAKALVNAGANIAGTTAGTIVDNSCHNKKLTTNLVRNNLIAGCAGLISGAISKPADGCFIGKNGQKTYEWLEPLDSNRTITSLTSKEPIDIAINNFFKEVGVSVAQEAMSKVVEEK